MAPPIQHCDLLSEKKLENAVALAAPAPSIDDRGGLNPAQWEAVSASPQPMLVIAGPGTGKTKTLTHRIAHLLKHPDARASSILALTFSNKAAKEMRHRLAALLRSPAASASTSTPEHGSLQGPWIGTFHAFAAMILRQHHSAAGLSANFTIIEPQDQRALVKRLLSAIGALPAPASSKLTAPTSDDMDTASTGDQEHDSPDVDAFVSAISACKNHRLTASHLTSASGSAASIAGQVGLPSGAVPTLATLLLRYSMALRHGNLVDFDDLLLLAATVLTDCPDVVERTGARFRHVLIDEFQDTNALQYDIARAVALASRPPAHRLHLASAASLIQSDTSSEHCSSSDWCCSLFAVGDPDQAIYSWRHADTARNLASLRSDFPSLKVRVLSLSCLRMVAAYSAVTVCSCIARSTA